MPANIVIYMGYGKERTMLTKKMETELNEQINKELYSSYLYLSMSAYCAEVGFAGFANWMRIQAKEELDHAMKLFDYILERGGNAFLAKIEQPDATWVNMTNVFEATLKHEQFITSSINHLMEVATEEKDFAAMSFLNWYVCEQIEEESNADELLKKLQFAGDDKNAVLMLDKELAARVYTPIAAE